MRILVGITGGIAAFKAATIVRSFTEQGHDVKVLPTENALRFIGSATLEALSHNAIDPDLYSQVADVKHIKLAQEADLIVVAPATAAFLARYATGIADDLLLNVLLASTAKVVVAPAMHTAMWEHPASVQNIATLKSRGVEIIEPTSGRLTGSDSGIGRMVEPEEIVRASLSLLQHGKDLLGKKVVIAAGGTREAIDAVRFIGNSSTGKQGIALANAAKDRGAAVTLIACNIDLALPTGVSVVRAVSTKDLQAELLNHIDADLILMPAAVSDYRLESPIAGKMHRSDDTTLNLQLVANPDLLQDLAEQKANASKPVLVGFAAEVVASKDDLLANAKAKLAKKKVEFIVANNVSGGGVFGSDENSVFIVGNGTATEISGSKAEIADAILDQVSNII